MSEPLELGNGSVEAQLGQVADEFTDRLNRGERPDVEDYARRYPEMAVLLRQLLPALQVMGPCSAPAEVGREQAAGESPVSRCLGDFRIIREAGRGGMGVVYEAEQVSLGRRVALKVLPFASTLDPRQFQRFHNEARAAAGLHHTNIVPVYAVGSERGVHYYAMQFIEGRTLADLVAQHRREAVRHVLTTDKAQAAAPSASTQRPAARATSVAPHDAAHFRRVAGWGIQAAEALDCAHALGVVHRDVKPANLLVDAAGRLWVTDFGLAQVQSDARLTMTGDLVGTLRYMSPEQALAKRVVVDHRTDLYSLGATLYELLTLEPAFAGTDRQELLQRIAFEEPKPPRRLNKAVPAELEVIVLKALEKNPADRYATAQELADDLRRFLEDRPIWARRASVVQRLRKLARRHQAVVTAAAVFSVLLIAVLGSGSGWYVRDRSSRQALVAARVTDALDQSEGFYRAGKVPEALAAARQAEGLLATGPADDALTARVRERVADFETVLQFDQVVFKNGETGARGAEYERLFRLNGIDLSVQSAEEAAARIRGRFIAEYLAWALHEWAGDEAYNRKRMAVARQADPDPWRDRIRQAVEQNDRATVEEVARTAPVDKLPPTTLRLIGVELLWGFGATPQRENFREQEQLTRDFLRRAQRNYPSDVWLNLLLGDSLWLRSPSNLDEAAGFYRVLVALRPNSPEIYLRFGLIMERSGKVDDAIRYYRMAGELDPNDPGWHCLLAEALYDKGLNDDALAECREALRLEADYPKAHCALGIGLWHKARPDEAIAEWREALRLKPNYAAAHTNLGNALRHKGQLDDAIREYRAAIQINPRVAPAHVNLGVLLCDDKADYDSAVAAFRAAIQINPQFAMAHYNLGCALSHKGDVEGAIREYQIAIQINPPYADAHCNLGDALVRQGRFAEALTAYKRAHELGSRKPGWVEESAQRVRTAEQFIALEEKLSKFLTGEARSVDAAEQLALAKCVQYKKLYAAATRFYTQAFAGQPALAGNLDAKARYDAACAAALAGCGQGEDAAKLDDQERARLRKQALDWLRTDLALRTKQAASRRQEDRTAARKALSTWLNDTDCAGVRGEALAKLPEAEREAWRRLWAEVAATRARAVADKQPVPK